MKSAGGYSMRALAIVSILLLASITPIIANAEENNLNFQNLGAPLPDSPEEAPLTYAFSPSVRSAFARVSDLSQYSVSELEATNEWVVVSDNPLGKPVDVLENVWIV